MTFKPYVPGQPITEQPDSTAAAESAPEVQPVESFPILSAGEEWSDYLAANRLEVDRDSNWEWLPHPTKPGQFVVALGVRECGQ